MSQPAAPPAIHQPRAIHHLLADLENGAESLHKLVSGWSPFAPVVRDLVGAEATVEGLRRVLSELRVAMDVERED